MRVIATAVAGCFALTGAAIAQETQDWTSNFARIKGGAVYDYKIGVDGTRVSEEFVLTHIVCTDGSKTLHVMLPYGIEDNAPDGKTTLKKVGGTYQALFQAAGAKIRRTLELKPVNDPKAHYKRQFMVKVDADGPLWKAMTSGKQDAALLLINGPGLPLEIEPDAKLDAALKSCGLSR